MKTFKQEYQINASAKDVFEALTNSKIIEKWSGSVAIMDNKVGTAFNLWDGFIYGTNTEVIENEKIVQSWYGGNWDQPSTVTFNLYKNENNTTTLILTHENVPLDSAHDFEIGWKQYYLGKIVDLFAN